MLIRTSKQAAMIVNSLGVVRLSAHITFLFVKPSPNGNTHIQISNHIKFRKKRGNRSTVHNVYNIKFGSTEEMI